MKNFIIAFIFYFAYVLFLYLMGIAQIPFTFMFNHSADAPDIVLSFVSILVPLALLLYKRSINGLVVGFVAVMLYDCIDIAIRLSKGHCSDLCGVVNVITFLALGFFVIVLVITNRIIKRSVTQ